MKFRKRILRNPFFDKKAFTLVELMVAAVLMIIAFVGILTAYIRCIELSEMSRNSSIALNGCKNVMEQIKNTTFTDIENDFDQVTFTIAGLNGIGVSYVDPSNPDLLSVKVAFCWRQKNGIMVGEDLDLDGTLDVSEPDPDNDNLVSSPVELRTFIYDE